MEILEDNIMGPYIYIEHSGDNLILQHVWIMVGKVRPIMWAQQGRYGWISKEQISNLQRRYADLKKQQKGYARNKPIDLAFHWSEVQPLDPVTVKLMREDEE